jgi:hypothetical protein
VKRVKQELSNVTYYVTTNFEEIDKKEWDVLREDMRTTKEVMVYYAINGDTEISAREYKELNEEEKQNYIQKPKTLYYLVRRQESKYSRKGAESFVRQELVNVLDEHGQLQWEDDSSAVMKPTRYLDAAGQVTDEANAVHTATLVECMYK